MERKGHFRNGGGEQDEHTVKHVCESPRDTIPTQRDEVTKEIVLEYNKDFDFD